MTTKTNKVIGIKVDDQHALFPGDDVTFEVQDGALGFSSEADFRLFFGIDSNRTPCVRCSLSAQDVHLPPGQTRPGLGNERWVEVTPGMRIVVDNEGSPGTVVCDFQDELLVPTWYPQGEPILEPADTRSPRSLGSAFANYVPPQRQRRVPTDHAIRLGPCEINVFGHRLSSDEHYVSFRLTGVDAQFDRSSPNQLVFGMDSRGWPYFKRTSEQVVVLLNGAAVEGNSQHRHYLDANGFDSVTFPQAPGMEVSLRVKMDGGRNFFSVHWTNKK